MERDMNIPVTEATVQTSHRLIDEFKFYAHSPVRIDLQALLPERPVQLFMQDLNTKYCQ